MNFSNIFQTLIFNLEKLILKKNINCIVLIKQEYITNKFNQFDYNTLAIYTITNYFKQRYIFLKIPGYIH